jgi:2-keto-3-deoxy-L-rhamnonate aldolase RhmA
MKNLVKHKLKSGKPSIGTWVSIGHPDVTMFLSDMGFDWIVCDMEHGPFGAETYHFMVQSMLYNRKNCVPMARVPYHDLIWYKKVLDAGAMGIVTPRVETKEMAKEMIKWMKYPPWGERGAGPRLAAFRNPDYFHTANDETMAIVMIESVKGVKNIEDIFSVEGIDACFVGPSDLSLDMGLHRQYTNPKFIKTLDRIVEAGQDQGVAPGMHCFTTPGPTNINKALERGFLWCALNSDTAYLRNGVQAAFKTVKGWSPREFGEEIAL